MRNWIVGLVVIAAAGIWGFTQTTGSAPQCYGDSGAIVPTLDRVEATLTNGNAGRDVYRAVEEGDVAQVEALLAGDPTLLSTRTELPDGTRPYAGNTADLLTAAVVTCDPAMVQALLDAGAEPDGEVVGTALTYAVLADDLEIATLLLEAGADPNAREPDHSTPLREVLMFERVEAVPLLARYGVDVDRANAVGRIPLASAMVGQNWALIEAMIETGANPWQVYGEGGLPAYNIYASEPADAEDQAIQARLLERIEDGAPIWPPVNSTEVRRNFLDGTWPTDEMREAGLFASDGAMRIMRTVGN